MTSADHKEMTMKKLILIGLTGLLTIVGAVPAMALGPLDVEAELPLYSKYVWRGMNNTNDWVLQPSLEVGVLGFTLGVWANMDLTDVNKESGEFKELDYTLGYSLGLAIVELGAGFVFYDYPEHARDRTSEFFLSGKANVLLSPSLSVYQDIDKYKGAYWVASVGHGFKVGESVNLDLTGGLGLGSKNFISGYYAGQMSVPNTDLGATMNDFFIRAEVPFHPIPFLSITPSVAYTSLLGDAKKAVEGDPALYAGKKDNVVWGLAAGFSF
jgi:hypothetical protein